VEKFIEILIVSYQIEYFDSSQKRKVLEKLDYKAHHSTGHAKESRIYHLEY